MECNESDVPVVLMSQSSDVPVLLMPQLSNVPVVLMPQLSDVPIIFVTQLSDMPVILATQLNDVPIMLMTQSSDMSVNTDDTCDVPVVLVHLSACNIVSCLCFSFSDLLDADVQDSLQNPDTDHEEHLAFHIRKSYNSPTACDKCIQTDLQILCKSAAMFRNVDTDEDWPVQHAEIHVGDSASVRV